MRRYKRISIDWEYLSQRMQQSGFTPYSLSKAAGLSTSILYETKQDNKINPAILDVLLQYVDFDIDKVIKEGGRETYRNGRSTSGRVGIDWDYLKRIAMEKGYSMKQLSLALGNSRGYLSTCKHNGGLSEDVLEGITKLLNLNSFEAIKLTSYSKLSTRKEIVEMIDGIEYK